MRSRPPRIPGFTLGTRLGGGSTSDVYSAIHLRTARTVALKILKDDLRLDPTNLALFQREGEIGMSVRHRHLLRVYKSEETFLVSERLPGVSFRTRLKEQKRIPPTRVISIGRQLATALHAMHEAGYIHGDVKPDNLHDLDGSSIKLLDFGFAHRPGQNGKLLGEGFVLGTANYIAPELCENHPVESFANDIFSLGVSLYEMLTGELPFPKGTVEETMLRHRDDAPIPLVRWIGPWSETLALLIDRMIGPLPQARPSALTVSHDLATLETLDQSAAA
jgi:eukaryotic-like serine/threonine-protein kinase